MARSQIVTFGDKSEKSRRKDFFRFFKKWPIPDEEFFLNLGLFLTPQTLSRILFMDFLYRQILEVQGVVMEFGCRWGQNLSLFMALRGIYEPFNRLRKIVGFDTFEGFPSTAPQDGEKLNPGMYAVTPNYDEYLDRILHFQEQESPLPHLQKYELVKGDASSRIHEYLEKHPETIVALAYFDMDIFKPTQDCLQAIKDRLTPGSILGFDELNDPVTPGETTAFKEVFGFHRWGIRRYRYNSRTSYVVFDRS
jgi:hypothetical protein